jgi:hypothetical protein
MVGLLIKFEKRQKRLLMGELGRLDWRKWRDEQVQVFDVYERRRCMFGR